MSDNPDAIETFNAPEIEFNYEHGVGLTVIAYKPTPWLSLEETQALAMWLTLMVSGRP